MSDLEKNTKPADVPFEGRSPQPKINPKDDIVNLLPRGHLALSRAAERLVELSESPKKDGDVWITYTLQLTEWSERCSQLSEQIGHLEELADQGSELAFGVVEPIRALQDEMTAWFANHLGVEVLTAEPGMDNDYPRARGKWSPEERCFWTAIVEVSIAHSAIRQAMTYGPSFLAELTNARERLGSVGTEASDNKAAGIVE